jgi:hypothetical protein
MCLGLHFWASFSQTHLVTLILPPKRITFQSENVFFKVCLHGPTTQNSVVQHYTKGFNFGLAARISFARHKIHVSCKHTLRAVLFLEKTHSRVRVVCEQQQAQHKIATLSFFPPNKEIWKQKRGIKCRNFCAKRKHLSPSLAGVQQCVTLARMATFSKESFPPLETIEILRQEGLQSMENFKAIKRRTPPIIFIPVTGSLIE